MEPVDLTHITCAEYWVKINESLFENLLLRIEIEDLKNEVKGLMTDKIDLAVENSQLIGGLL